MFAYVLLVYMHDNLAIILYVGLLLPLSIPHPIGDCFFLSHTLYIVYITVSPQMAINTKTIIPKRTDLLTKI